MNIGAKLTEIRAMTGAEMDAEGWDRDNFHGPPPVLVFDDGSKVYPSQDEEGNGAGALFGIDAEGAAVRIFVKEEG